jgi:hypothetical protein
MQDGQRSGGSCPCAKKRQLQEKAARLRKQQVLP